jgi:hypothetical protein
MISLIRELVAFQIELVLILHQGNLCCDLQVDQGTEPPIDHGGNL